MNLYEALLSDEAAINPTLFEQAMAAELLWLVREVLEARTGYIDHTDKKEAAQRILYRTLAAYRDWINCGMPAEVKSQQLQLVSNQ